MTTDQLESEIAYMKSMALSGGHGPLKNGASLFWAGLLYGAGSIGQYAINVGYLPQSPWTAAGLWFGISIVYAIIMIVTLGGVRRGRETPATRASHSAWSAVALGIFAFMISMIVMANIVHDFNTLSFVMAPVILVLYGVGWWVSAVASGARWLRVVAFGAFAGAPVLCLLTGRAEQMLAYAVALFLFAMAPGFVLMRAEKA